MAAMASSSEFFAKPAVGITCATGLVRFSADGAPALEPHCPEHRCRHVLPGSWPVDIDADAPASSLLAKLLGGCFRNDEAAAAKMDLLAEIAGAAALGYGTRLIAPKAVVLA